MNFAVSVELLSAYTFVLFRVAALIFMAPIFRSDGVPTMVKAGISFWITISFLGAVDPTTFPLLNDPFVLTIGIITEILIGVTIGFIAQVIVIAGVFGGHILGKHMGLAIANVFDPVSNASVSIIGTYFNLIIILMLLAMDYHLILLNVIYGSYQIIPPLGASYNPEMTEVLVTVGGQLFVFALQLAAPVFVGLFFVEVMIAFMAKLGKQFNVLMLQFPIKIFIGLLLMPVFLLRLAPSIEIMIAWVLRTVHQALSYLAG